MDNEFTSPVYGVKAVPVERIRANSYNPNVTAPPEMRLLELSIWEDGYICRACVITLRKRMCTSLWTAITGIRS